MRVKLVTYNIDGLPDTVDLEDLPWALKPLTWAYKLIKGTTIVPINDGTYPSDNSFKIGQYLASTEADIIVVQEDFNHHNDLITALQDYNCGTYSGEISINNTKWFPYPHCTADGLNLFTKGSIKSEEIKPWKASYGYFSHANDKLTTKGFRSYCVTVNGVDIDVYVVHMDADYYDPILHPDIVGDIKARKKQLTQLVKYIKSKGSDNPIIILGDTNSQDKYGWDEDNVKTTLIDQLGAKEAKCATSDVDRLFYIDGKTHKIEVKEAYYDDVGLSDHKPFVVTIEVGESE